MGAYIGRRLLATLVVMAIVGLIVFLLLHLAPGSPAAIIAGDNATPAQIALINRQLGLDRPLPVQFGVWAWDVLRGRFGTSIFSGVPVMDLVVQRVPATVSLSLVTIVFAATLAVTGGVLAAWRVGGLLDRTLMAVAALGFSVPVFVVGYLLIYVFAIRLRWLPVQGYVPMSGGLWPWFSHLMLPALALGLAYLALISRITRAAVLEVLAEDYIRTARAKGASEARVLFRHALRGGLLPVVSFLGPAIAGILTGSFVIETIFQIPGIGREFVNSAFNRDYTLVLGTVILYAVFIVVMNLAVDVVQVWLNPKLRFE